MSLLTCPSSTDLERLCLSGLPENEAVALEEHVQECRPCLERLIALLPAHDTLSDALAGRDTLSTPASAHPLVAELIRKLEQVAPPSRPLRNPEVRMLTFTCSSCQKKLSVKETSADKKVKCPGCGMVMAVPVPVPAGGPKAQVVPQPSLTETPSELFAAQFGPGASVSPTNPSLSKPDATLGVQPDSSHDSSLSNFLAPPQADDEIGRLGVYRILKILGHGGMGVVFLGEDPALNRRVAVKAMLPHLAQSKSSRERFVREARTAAALEHDHIVAIYQVGEDRGAPYLVMPLLKGEPLDDRLKREPVLPLREVLRIGRETAEGLAAAHANGLIHRDIKPANIWLEAPRDRVKILDFGLARAVAQDSALTQQGAIIGTPAYMSPEQARGATVDARSDLFSLGVVLYRMSTGQQPFHGKDTVSTLMEVAMHEPAPPIMVNFELPQELSDLVMKLLEKDPDKRIASAKEVIAALQKMEDGLRRQKAIEEQTQAVSFVPPTNTTAVAKPIASDTQTLDSPAARRRNKKPLLKMALLFLGGLVVLAGGIAGIIRIAGPGGDYVIETDDPDISFKVSKGEVTLMDEKLKRPYKLKVITQDNGKFKLEVTDLTNELSFQTDTFTMKRGEKIALKVWFERKAPEIAKGGPVDDAWIKMVAGLPAKDQVKAVADKLKERNPGFDGKINDHKIEAGVVTELSFFADNVTDISPVRALAGLRVFACTGSSVGKGKLGNLSPLKDLKLTDLSCQNTKVSDLSPLKDMKLRILVCYDTQVSDLSPLKDMTLSCLYCNTTRVTDLSPLKNMRLTVLWCRNGWEVTDPSPLKGMPLDDLQWDYKAERDGAILRSITSLKTINYKPAAQFWQEVDGTSPPPADFALRFDGSAFVNLPKLPLSAETPFTLEAWVNPDTGDMKKQASIITLTYLAHLRTNSTGGAWWFNLQGSSVSTTNSKAGLGSKRPIHLAGVYTGKELLLFVDGKLVERKEHKIRGAKDPATTVFGENWLGLIDEVRISKVARYDKEFTPAKRFEPDKDTLALYHFDEGQGDVLKDSSGNKHDGKIVGAKWVKAEPPASTVWSLDFDGNGRVNLPALALKVDEPLTAEVWVTPRVQTSDKNPAVFVVGWIHLNISIIKSGEWPNNRWAIWLPDGKHFGRNFWSGQEFSPGKRTHLAAVWSGKEIDFYVNGQLQRDHDTVTVPKEGDRWFFMGEKFQGQFHQFRVSKAQRYQGQTVPISESFESDAKTLILYRFDEGQGDKLTDLSGKGNHGKIVGAKWVKADGSPNPFPPLDPAWLQAVAAMKAEQQVEAVKAELMKRNLGLDGKIVTHRIEAGVVAELGVHSDNLTDLSPVRALTELRILGCGGAWNKVGKTGPLANLSPLQGMKLTKLTCYSCQVADLSPLKGMKLTELHLGNTKVTDLSPLKDMKLTTFVCSYMSVSDLSPLKEMPLTVLHCPNTRVADLSPLKGMPLTFLQCGNTPVADLSPLQGMGLTSLECFGTNVSDLSPLKGMPLFWLRCDNTAVSDLAPLKGMKLGYLHCQGTKVSDLTPLKGMPLYEINCNFKPFRDTEMLRSIKSLQKINNKDAKQFWAEVDAQQAVFDAWVKQVAAMKAEQQVEAVKAELMKRNPGFDGKIYDRNIEAGVVTEFRFFTDNVTDISPARALTGLQKLHCQGSAPGKGKLADLAPLKDLKLTGLGCAFTNVSDLSPLNGMKLTWLNCDYTQVSDLSPLKDMKLDWLHSGNNKVSDLSPLKGMPLAYLVCSHYVSDLSPLKGAPLRTLACYNPKVSDLSPLKGAPLKELWWDFKPFRDAEILRSFKTLETINDKDAKQFWKEADAQQAAFDAWVKQVAAMKAEQQVEAVKAELMKRNPGFDGKVTPVISKDGVVTELSFLTDNVTDISPVRALVGLQTLICGGTPYQRKGQLADLSPLKGMKLTRLSCYDTKVSDLSPLKDMKLTYLNFGSTEVSDLSALKDMKLTELACDWAKVSDLSPLKDMKLTYLECRGTQVTDLLPLKGMPLKEIKLDFKADRDGPILRSVPTLEKINDKDAKEFLKAASTSALPPLDPAWLKAVAAMPAKEQIEAVKAELMKRNPGFDGKTVTHKLDKDGTVTELQFFTDTVIDLSPVRALTQLKSLYCPGIEGKERKLADLTPLAGMRLEHLDISITSVSDLSPLKDMKLKTLSLVAAPVADLTPLRGMEDDLTWLNIGVTNVSDLSPLQGMKKLDGLVFYKTPVADLSPLKGMKLTNLQCFGTKVTDLAPLQGMKLASLDCSWTKVPDLSPLKNMPLISLNCSETLVADLSPLKGMPLENLRCNFKKGRDNEILRSIETLKEINGKPAAEVLK